MSSDDPTRLATWLGRVLHWGSVMSTALLGIGLLLSVIGLPAGPVFGVGLAVLMATPVTRVVVSVVEYTAQRDWPFVALTGFVFVILLGSLVIALVS